MFGTGTNELCETDGTNIEVILKVFVKTNFLLLILSGSLWRDNWGCGSSEEAHAMYRFFRPNHPSALVII